jgi:hypothetical protein
MFRVIALNAERNLIRFSISSRGAHSGAVTTHFDKRHAYPAIGK